MGTTGIYVGEPKDYFRSAERMKEFIISHCFYGIESEHGKILDIALRKFNKEAYVLYQCKKTKVENFVTIICIKLSQYEGYLQFKEMEIQCHPYMFNAPKKMVKKLLPFYEHFTQYGKNWIDAYKLN